MKLADLIVAVVFGALVQSTPASATNLIANGSFESHTVLSNSGTWQVFTSLPSWQVNGQYIELQRNGLFGSGSQNQATHGVQWAELDYPGTSAQISQNVFAANAAAYLLTFDYSSRPGFGEQSLGIFWNGNLIGSVGGNGNSNQLNWQSFSFQLDGFSGINSLGFGSLANYASDIAAGGNLLDNVSLTAVDKPVPEPATAAMLGAGLLAVYRRKIAA
jgi:Protein of unknown function (DUF642)/PEP-CTERM motif